MHNAAEFGIAAQWMYKGKRKFASKSYQDAGAPRMTFPKSAPACSSSPAVVAAAASSLNPRVRACSSLNRCKVVGATSRRGWREIITQSSWTSSRRVQTHQRRQGTSEFFISEFCYCVDQRWHRVDNLGHKTRVTAELVNPLDDVIEDESWEEDVDDIDARIRQLQTVAGTFFNDESSDEKAETSLGNWSAAAAEIQKRRRAVAMRKDAAREASWRSATAGAVARHSHGGQDGARPNPGAASSRRRRRRNSRPRSPCEIQIRRKTRAWTSRTASW